MTEYVRINKLKKTKKLNDFINKNVELVLCDFKELYDVEIELDQFESDDEENNNNKIKNNIINIKK